MNTNGDCYEKNGKEFINTNFLHDKDSFLCHGIVWHKLVNWHGHCWIEKNNHVFDFSNGNSIVIEKNKYYKLGKIRSVKRYSFNEFIKFIVKFENWGPWSEVKK